MDFQQFRNELDKCRRSSLEIKKYKLMLEEIDAKLMHVGGSIVKLIKQDGARARKEFDILIDKQIILEHRIRKIERDGKVKEWRERINNSDLEQTEKDILILYYVKGETLKIISEKHVYYNYDWLKTKKLKIVKVFYKNLTATHRVL